MESPSSSASSGMRVYVSRSSTTSMEAIAAFTISTYVDLEVVTRITSQEDSRVSIRWCMKDSNDESQIPQLNTMEELSAFHAGTLHTSGVNMSHVDFPLEAFQMAKARTVRLFQLFSTPRYTEFILSPDGCSMLSCGDGLHLSYVNTVQGKRVDLSRQDIVQFVRKIPEVWTLITSEPGTEGLMDNATL